MSSDRHKFDLCLASCGRSLLHISQLMEVHDAHQVLPDPLMKSSPFHNFQVEPLDLSENWTLNTGQWQDLGEDPDVCHTVHGQNLRQALHCSKDYFGSGPCNENTVFICCL